MRFSLFEYFELNNTPFGQLVYRSVIRLSHFPKGPYFWENMYKIGKILIWLVGYFPDQKFYRGKGLLYEENNYVISRTLY